MQGVVQAVSGGCAEDHPRVSAALHRRRIASRACRRDSAGHELQPCTRTDPPGAWAPARAISDDSTRDTAGADWPRSRGSWCRPAGGAAASAALGGRLGHAQAARHGAAGMPDGGHRADVAGAPAVDPIRRRRRAGGTEAIAAGLPRSSTAASSTPPETSRCRSLLPRPRGRTVAAEARRGHRPHGCTRKREVGRCGAGIGAWRRILAAPVAFLLPPLLRGRSLSPRVLHRCAAIFCRRQTLEW